MNKRYQENLDAKSLKLPLAEVHPQFELSLAEVYKVSLEKGYTPNNWLDTDLVSTVSLINAARRHINKYLHGEIYNREPGCDTVAMHLEHAAYSLLMAATQLRNNDE